MQMLSSADVKLVWNEQSECDQAPRKASFGIQTRTNKAQRGGGHEGDVSKMIHTNVNNKEHCFDWW